MPAPDLPVPQDTPDANCANAENPAAAQPPSAPAPTAKVAVQPAWGEKIHSSLTDNTYTIGLKIGEGNFSVVYACADDWNNELAAKVLKPKGTYEAVQESARQEMLKLFQLRHPHITHVFDFFEFRDTFYIITERCGFCLTELFNFGWLEGPLWVLPIARSLLQAMDFIHLSGFVHQDIHPGNVFALLARNELDPTKSESTQFRLGDLGVAKLLDQNDGNNTRAQWMLPPEVLEPKEYGPLDRRIDIYHCGLLLLQLAHSKELRFTNEEILAGEPRQMALALPQPLNFALEKALRRHASLRTASARELWRDLNSPGQDVDEVPDQEAFPLAMPAAETPEEMPDTSAHPAEAASSSPAPDAAPKPAEPKPTKTA